MKNNTFSHEFFMKKALEQAEIAYLNDEVPVGAVIVCKNQIISKGYNFVEHLTDVTAHAEIQAITSAISFLGSKYLNNCTLYSTLEPCVMCAGAANLARIDQIVYGAYDNKKGFSKHLKLLNPNIKLVSGILIEDCRKILKDFFIKKR